MEKKKNGHFVQRTVRPPLRARLALPWYLEPKLQIYIKIIIILYKTLCLMQKHKKISFLVCF